MEGKDAVGGILVLAGAALLLWGITGRRITFRDVGLRTAPDEAEGQISHRTRTVLAIVFGVALVAAGILVVTL